MKILIRYKHIFYVCLVLIANLCSMENKIDIKLDSALCFELLLRNIIHIDHHIVGALSLTNKKLNKMVHQTIEQRKKYLLSHAITQANYMPLYIVYHALGSACTFVTATDRTPKNAWGYNINLNRLQLVGSNKIYKYTYRIMTAQGWKFVKLHKENTDYAGKIYEHKFGNTHLITITKPAFDSYGNAHIKTCLYSPYPRYFLIDQFGKNRQ
jgi:hypothetical protein